MGCLKATCKLLNKAFSAITSLQNKPFLVTCSLVCSIKIEPLTVIPKSVQWVDVDDPVSYRIITNENWTIE